MRLRPIAVAMGLTSAVALLGFAVLTFVFRLGRGPADVPADAVVVIDGEPVSFERLKVHEPYDGLFESEGDALSWIDLAVTSYLLSREDVRQGGGGSPVMASVREEERVLAASPITAEQLAAEYERKRETFIHPTLATAEFVKFPIEEGNVGRGSILDRAFVLAQATVRVASREQIFRKIVSGAAVVRNVGPFRCSSGTEAFEAVPSSVGVPREVQRTACTLRDGSMSRPFASEDGGTGYVVLQAWVSPARNVSLEEASRELHDELTIKARAHTHAELIKRLRREAKVEIIRNHVRMSMVREVTRPRNPSDLPPRAPGIKEVSRDL